MTSEYEDSQDDIEKICLKREREREKDGQREGGRGRGRKEKEKKKELVGREKPDQ